MSTESNANAEEALLLRKQIASTRTFLIIVAVVTLISAMILLPSLPNSTTLISIVLISISSGAYFLLASWTKKKPYSAVLAGFLILLVNIVVDIVWSPFGPLGRWQSKTITLLMLFMAMSDSKDAQQKMTAPPTPPTPPAQNPSAPPQS